MKKLLSENIAVQLIFLALVVLISRIPFLWAGYGAEEDSWLLPLTAKNMALSGAYEMSRAPGHPLQEFLYALIWNAGPFVYNLLSALASVMATLFFTLSLKNLNLKHYLFAAFGFAFTPVIFIASTYTVDYMFAMAFVMGSFYFLTQSLQQEIAGEIHGKKTAQKFTLQQRNILGAGIFLGIAVGYRITSAVMAIPFLILFFSYRKGDLKQVTLFVSVAMLVGLLTYLPVLNTYGLNFFTYSDQFPYPNIPKVIYKATFGVFGFIGILSIIYFTASLLASSAKKIKKNSCNVSEKKLILACITVILLYTIAYLRLPQKSDYMIPIIPFVILLFGYYLSGKAFRIFCVLLILSSLFFSINLSNSIRGAAHSSLSVQFKMAGQDIFIDPITGPIYSDYSKRLNKIAFTKKVYKKTGRENKKIVLVCGWWYNQFLVYNWGNAHNPNVIPAFYLDKAAMNKYKANGYEIFYLPEQNIYNDLFSKMDCTDSLANPYL